MKKNLQHTSFENYAKLLNISLDEAKRLGKIALEYTFIFRKKEKRETEKTLKNLYKNKDFVKLKKMQTIQTLNEIESMIVKDFYDMKLKATLLLENLEKKKNISFEENAKKEIIMDILKLKLVTAQ